MFKAKRLIEKGGTVYLNQVPWSPQQTIPDHRLYLSIQFKKFLSKTYSRCINMPHPYKHTQSYKQTNTHTDSFSLSLTHILSLSLSLSLMHTGTCIKCVNTFDWGIFGAVWKCRGGGQEFSAEVIRAAGWGSLVPPFSISVFVLNILPFFMLR